MIIYLRHLSTNIRQLSTNSKCGRVLENYFTDKMLAEENWSAIGASENIKNIYITHGRMLYAPTSLLFFLWS